ncbi:MAG: membrane protein insertion efficiency factor YidD [Bacteroidetes bacterium]|nr:membrane protein insertion efficiency factor YidD [Bacteroidota bacterium]
MVFKIYSISPLKRSTFFLLMGVLFFSTSSMAFADASFFSDGTDDSLLIVVIPNNDHSKKDFELMATHERKNPYPIKKKPSFLLVGKKNIVKYNPVSLLFGGMLYTYQATISSQIAADCPYEVSCSAFSKQSILEFGLIKGLALSADRVTRCTKSSIKQIHSLRISENGNIIDFPSYYRLKKHTHE